MKKCYLPLVLLPCALFAGCFSPTPPASDPGSAGSPPPPAVDTGCYEPEARPFAEAIAFVRAWDSLLAIADNAGNRACINRNYAIWLRKKRELDGLEALRERLGLPEKAVLYEFIDLEKAGAPERALAVWILDPQIFLDGFCDGHGCPAEVYGKSSIYGKIHFSLLDTRQGRIMNTLTDKDLHRDWDEPGSCLILPLALPGGQTYHTQNGTEEENLVTALFCSDFNHDGVRAEFPLYEYGACGWIRVSLLGYLPAEDRLAQLEFRLDVDGKIPLESGGFRDSSFHAIAFWMPNLPVQHLKTRLAVSYGFYGGHGMETGDLFDIQAIPQTGHFQGARKIAPANELTDETIPWAGSQHYHN